MVCSKNLNDSFQTAAKTAEQLVCNGMTFSGKLSGGDLFRAGDPDEHSGIALFNIRKMADIYECLIHADPADNGSALSADQNRAVAAGKLPGQSVRVADRQNGDLHVMIRGEGETIADGFSGIEGTDGCHACLQGENRLQRADFMQIPGISFGAE